uniref:iron-sulfur cluster assembly scaffold protein n=1 Tax=Parerythrobacter lutipelagi TaxID=1964208 RepID=UPI001F01F9C1|nr:iron-sulfur cluster assembly scaffold protein [Parerythrobacter lutipelagi]
MPDSGLARLYTPNILSLAVELAIYPLAADFQWRGDARSRTCGSEVVFACNVNGDGGIADFGLQAKACAIGQAAASLFARGAKGRTGSDIGRTVHSLEIWLAGTDDLPDWQGLEILQPAREHRGRHDAILLPWKAALAALSNSGQPR